MRIDGSRPFVHPKKTHLIGMALGLFILSAVSSFTFLYMRPTAAYSSSIPDANTSATSTSPTLPNGALPALADPDYYAHIKQQLLELKTPFINANLSTMRLDVYTDGQLTLSVPILAKGKVGSWWETPVGIYRVEMKENDHFSSIGHVHQPWSLQFQGNFFIHGWPYFEDGALVSSSYSGGCIRLATEDAAKVFELAKVDMPVIVYDTAYQGDPFTYHLKPSAKISADEYLVADLDNGTVLAGKEASTTAPIASITKLITALVATEYINLDKKITILPDALVYTTVPRLHPGEHIKAYDLLFLLLQESSNEAAEALAADLDRDDFIDAMNRKAASIGLSDTDFNDPSGAKEDLSTPEDLFKLLRYIYTNRRFVFDITTGEMTDSAYGSPLFQNLNNFNTIKQSPVKLLGGKVGQTDEAGETYAGIFAIPIAGQERKIAIIVLGSRDVQSDVATLAKFVKRAYARNNADLGT